MAAIAPRKGGIRKLDREGQPPEHITPELVQDPKLMSRIITRLLDEVAGLQRRFHAASVEHEDVDLPSGGAAVRLPHHIGAHTRFIVTSWSSPVSPVPQLTIDASSDRNTLVLRSYVVGTATILVEQAG